MVRATPLPPDERRAALMAATEPLLERYGREVSTRQIAEAAGVAEGTIFRAFSTKDALIDACLQEAFDVGRTCALLTALDPGLPLEERLVRAVDLLQARMRRIVALFHTRRMPPPTPGGPAELHAKHRDDNAALTDALVTVLRPDAGRLRIPPHEAALALRALVFALSHPVLGDGRLSTPAEIVDLVLHGVLDPSPEEPPC